MDNWKQALTNFTIHTYFFSFYHRFYDRIFDFGDHWEIRFSGGLRPGTPLPEDN